MTVTHSKTNPPSNLCPMRAVPAGFWFEFQGELWWKPKSMVTGDELLIHGYCFDTDRRITEEDINTLEMEVRVITDIQLIEGAPK